RFPQPCLHRREIDGGSARRTEEQRAGKQGSARGQSHVGLRTGKTVIVGRGQLYVNGGGQIEYRSTYSWTGMPSSVFRSRLAARIASCCLEGNRRARFVRNFSTNNGMPSLRRRLWPIGYSTTTSFNLRPSFSSTVSALAIDRFSGSWESLVKRGSFTQSVRARSASMRGSAATLSS